jgi:hypothetical protein
MHINKKSHLMFYFLRKYRIPPTAMQLNALELIYNIYLLGPCFVAEGPAERKQLRLKLLERNAEGIIYEASVIQHVRR